MSKPLIIQSDATLLLDLQSEESARAQNRLSTFAELEKSPEYIHTYKITPLSLWNAADAGLSKDYIIAELEKYSRYPIPLSILQDIDEHYSRYGKIKLFQTEDPNILRLEVSDALLDQIIANNKQLKKYLEPGKNQSYTLQLLNRGIIKVELIRLGFPVIDMVPMKKGSKLDFALKESSSAGDNFTIRPYQEKATQALIADKSPGTGFGCIVLPCGAGKTIVGINAIEKLQTETLILTPNIQAVHQWQRELLKKSNIDENMLGEYSGSLKEIKPITVATYQVLTWRRSKLEPFIHFELFRSRNWGLIIYDEVHLLPAPVFRVVAEIQSVRRLGLTATLVREDGEEDAVFSLVGPKKYDVPWKEMEAHGWIAQAECHEIRVELRESDYLKYITATPRSKIRIASENSEKNKIVRQILAKHRSMPTIIIGQYISQLQNIAESLALPIITGKTPNRQREELYNDFRSGKKTIIVVSKIANFAIDLPDAAIAIQLSGSFGSRQEEAQRLGRILRPKDHTAFFYTLVSRYTVEEEFAFNRKKFLIEQGYKYNLEIGEPNEFAEAAEPS